MSGYVQSWDFTAEFDGDTVTARLRPMTKLQALKFQSLVARADGEASLPEFFYELAGANIESLSGLRDAGGNALGVEQLVRDSYFMGLVSQIGRELLQKATPRNPKAPGVQPDGVSPG